MSLTRSDEGKENVVRRRPQGAKKSRKKATKGSGTKKATKSSTSKAAVPTDTRTSTAPSTSTVRPQGRAGPPGVPVRCWAHGRTGKRCVRLVESREDEPIPVPYCDAHLRSGDGALKVVSHPFAGKCLVARYDLPAKYRIAFWGNRGQCASCSKEDRAISFYPPDKRTGRNVDPRDGSVKTTNYNGVLNPGGTGDVIQYAACPGPTERQNMRSTFQYWGVRNGDMGGLEFVTLEPVPKNTQLCHWYGSGWWSARGVKRLDVGTTRYPAPKRISSGKRTKQSKDT